MNLRCSCISCKYEKQKSTEDPCYRCYDDSEYVYDGKEHNNFSRSEIKDDGQDDYVKRSDVHKVFQPKYAPAINRTFAAMIDSVPAADVVEVVRCQYCKYRIVNKHFGEKGYMNLKAICALDTNDPFELGRSAEIDDWFCADGEHKEGGQDDGAT